MCSVLFRGYPHTSKESHLRKPSSAFKPWLPIYVQRSARKPILIAPQILFSVQKLGGFISISNFEKEGDKAKCQIRGISPLSRQILVCRANPRGIFRVPDVNETQQRIT